MSSSPLVFSTESYGYMADALCATAGLDPGDVEKRRFPDGERYQRVLTDTGDRDVIVVGGTISDSDTLELYDLASALVHYGARRLIIVIPFFGYSTMERRVHFGEVVTAKARARLLSSIPIAAMGNRVLLVDLHVDAVTYYFEGATRSVHVYAKELTQRAISELGGDDFVLGSTDAGRAKWVESLASDLGVDAGFVYKRRRHDGRAEVSGVSAHVAGRGVVIYDDMIRTGGSLIAAARAYRDNGATAVSAVCTHGVFPGSALERIESSGVVDRIICTDTHPRARELECDFLEVRSVAPILARSIGGTP